MDKKRSVIWQHFSEFTGNRAVVICNYCTNRLSIKGGSTTNLSRHLRVKHPESFKSPPVQTTITRVLKKPMMDDNLQSFMKTCSNAVNNSNGKPDEYEALGINYAAKIRKMNPDQQIYAELLFQKVITKGLLGQLHADIDLANTKLKVSKTELNWSENVIDLAAPSEAKFEIL